ncbi:hypothetical protein Tco_1257477, partial [Tanacetum coccineum]
NDVPLPPKETVRAGMAIMGLFDKDKPSLSPTVLGSHDQLNINQQTIAYSLIWGLEIDIRAIIFSDLKLLRENYINGSLTFVKPHTISAASFQKPLASEVPLTSHMLKVAKLFQEPKQSLILSSEKVNANDSTNKSLSGTSVQRISQPKAPTNLKAKKKRILPSSKPKSSYKARVILPKKQVAETQHAEETKATADTTQSLGA